ncbi:MAG: beta-ketoacyl-[acyl-carrier-protein] synthase family protein [Kiritimatiellia bacterium]
MKAAPRIAVTGMGAVSPFGAGADKLWEALCSGRSGIRDITCFDTSEYKFKRAGEVTGFELPDGVKNSGLSRAESFGVTAALEARNGRGSGEDTALVLATNFGGIDAAGDFLAYACGEKDDIPEGFDGLNFQSCADRMASELGFRGHRSVVSLSCASGTAALATAAEMIASGKAKAVLTVGFDALSRFAWSGLSSLRTMTRDEIRPFDADRSGTLFSEGAGAVLVEDMESAVTKGSDIMAELAGWATGNNAYHMTAPAREGEGSRLVMTGALEKAGISAGEIDHVNAHGTGTRPNDVTETQAVKAALGPRAYQIPVTSVKSMTGHMMGAAGSVEAIASVMSINTGIVPPTINYRKKDPECDLDYVPNLYRKVEVNTVLSNSAGIGGCNAAVVLRKAGSP